MFRGVGDKEFGLIPSLGRGTFENTGGDISLLERDLLEEFKRLSIPVLNKEPLSEFEWLFLAQHYGLPTRLLDWSANPMVALFFAVEGHEDKDAALYIVEHPVTDQYEDFDYKTADITEESKRTKPILGLLAIQPNQRNFIFIRPKYLDQRYLNQKSIFSCHTDPFKILSHSSLVKLVIKKEWKDEIRKRLAVMGITHSFLYPGLDGIAKEVKSNHYEPIKSGKLNTATFRCTIPSS